MQKINTRIETMKESIDEEGVRRAGAILRAGGLVAFPTETVYGLGGNALDISGAGRIYEAKGRPSDNPLIVHIAELEALYKIAEEVPREALKLAEAFWPGPLTMIFKRKDCVPDATTGGLGTVAVRMPNHPIALALIRAGGGFVAAPSANTSGRPSPTKVEHVIEDLWGRVDMIIDGGEVGIGLESTIVDLSEEVPVILRPGFINEAMLREVIGQVQMDKGLVENGEQFKPKAPGMKYRHYAPKASLVVVEGRQEQVTKKINELIEKELQAGGCPGVIATDETRELYHGGMVKSIGVRSDERTIARHLYSVLRDFDQLEVTRIYSEAFETPKMGQAIMNRLMKAAGHQIIRV